MKINKEKIKELTALEDDRLWQVITQTAQKYGYSLPAEAPSKKEMAKLRNIMNEAEKISAKDILKLMTSFKEKKNKE